MQGRGILGIILTTCALIGVKCATDDGISSNTAQQETQTYTIGGTVTDGSGNALPGATVVAEPGGLSTVSLTDGSFTLDGLPEGTYSLHYHLLDYRDTLSAALAVGASAVLADAGAMQLTYRYGTIQGQIVDAGGMPVIMAGIAVERQVSRDMSLTNGEFFLSKVEPGTVKLFAAYPGMGYGSFETTVVSDDTVKNVQIVLDRMGGTVSGRLFKPTGTAKRQVALGKQAATTQDVLSGAVVTAVGGVISDTTDSSGTFSLSGVPSGGDVSLTVTSGSDSMDIGGIQAVEGGQSDIGDVPVVKSASSGGITLKPSIVFANSTDQGITILADASTTGSVKIRYFAWDIDSDGTHDTTTSSPMLEIATGAVGTRYVGLRAQGIDSTVYATTSITVVVRDENLQAYFIHGPSWMTDRANVGEQYTDTVYAVDANNDPLIFSFVDSTIGMGLDDSIITWLPGAEALGLNKVAVAVTDGKGVYDTLSWVVVVAEATDTTASDMQFNGAWRLYTARVDSAPLGVFGNADMSVDVIVDIFTGYTIRYSYSDGDSVVAKDTLSTVVKGDTLVLEAMTSDSTPVTFHGTISGNYLVLRGESGSAVAVYTLLRHGGAVPPAEWSGTGTVTADTTAPELTIVTPHNGDTLTTSTITAAARATDPSGVAAVIVNGKRMEIGLDGVYSARVSCTEGPNVLVFSARDYESNIAHSDSITVFVIAPPDTGSTDTTRAGSPPMIVVEDPQPGDTVTVSPIVFRFHVFAERPLVAVSTSDTSFPVDSIRSSAEFATPLTLTPGMNSLTITARDKNGTTATMVVNYMYNGDTSGTDTSTIDTGTVDTTTPGTDTQGPSISVMNPSCGSTVIEQQVWVEIQATDPSGVERVMINEEPAEMTDSSRYAIHQPLSLTSGANMILIKAFDMIGNQSIDTCMIYYSQDTSGTDTSTIDTGTVDTTTPGTDTQGPSISVVSPTCGSTIDSSHVWVRARITDPSGLGMVLIGYDNGEQEDSITYRSNRQISLSPGSNMIIIRADDLAGNQTIDTCVIYYSQDTSGTDTTTTDTTTTSGGDTQGPSISFTDPVCGSTSKEQQIWVQVEVTDQSGVETVRINDLPATREWGNSYRSSEAVQLSAGSNVIFAMATDTMGNQSADTCMVNY
ncbi:MAG: hypothetical protein GF401_14915 [Chitinivibrionales bacterium]|nr:hypothetical protein [Chitinivibrionales bacterium]